MWQKLGVSILHVATLQGVVLLDITMYFLDVPLQHDKALWWLVIVPSQAAHADVCCKFVLSGPLALHGCRSVLYGSMLVCCPLVVHQACSWCRGQQKSTAVTAGWVLSTPQSVGSDLA